MRKSERRFHTLYALPTVVFLFALTIFPFIFSFYLSLNHWEFIRGLRSTWEFVGGANYAKILSDSVIFEVMQNTAVYVGLQVLLQILIGTGLALLYSKDFVGRRFVVPAALVPMLLAPITAGMIWKVIMQSHVGVLNYLLEFLNVPQVDWVGDARISLYSVILVDVWQWAPFVMLIVLAGLQGIPKEHIEASMIDGASSLQRFKYITLPSIIPFLVIAALIRVMDSISTVDTIFYLTEGGPGSSSTTLAYYIYTLALKRFHMDYAAAVSYVLLILVAGLTFGFLYTTSKKEELGRL